MDDFRNLPALTRFRIADAFIRGQIEGAGISETPGPDGEVALASTGDDDLVNQNPCHLYHYQTTRFQVGTGGSANEGEPGSEASSTVSLGQPLTKEQYGNSLMSVNITSGHLYMEDNTLLGKQDFGLITGKSPVASSVVHVWSLDEETANGQLLDEAGLFVHNPYLKRLKPRTSFVNNTNIQLVGGTTGTRELDDIQLPRFEPGHLLAAYRKFPPIKKESYFTLLFRWSISFPTGF